MLGFWQLKIEDLHVYVRLPTLTGDLDNEQKYLLGKNQIEVEQKKLFTFI